jgi:hypothetical protein
MDFKYGSQIQKQSELHTAVCNGSERIVNLYPDTYKTVTGTWELTKDDRDRALITLTLKDTASAKEAVVRFTPKDVESSDFIVEEFKRRVSDVL